MLLITAPPGHEKYFDELRDLIAKGGKPDRWQAGPRRARQAACQVRHGTTRRADTRLIRDRTAKQCDELVGAAREGISVPDPSEESSTDGPGT